LCSYVSGSVATWRSSITTAGAISGLYSDGRSVYGFIRDAQGTFTCFGAPGSFSPVPFSINNAGAVTGWHGNHGFIRDAQGTFTSFDVEGSNFRPPDLTGEIGRLNENRMSQK